MIREGRARRFGDDVNTDYIISSSRKKATIDADVLKEWLLESVDPDFAASVRPGDILVAGKNFGCGSAMEVAATVIVAAGIGAVLAQGFARSFYRNAINNGLLVVECDTTAIVEGDRVRVRLEDGVAQVEDVTRRVVIDGEPLPGIMLSILEAGGVVPYLKEKRRFAAGGP